jgi:SAM-dependent methyltransferase
VGAPGRYRTFFEGAPLDFWRAVTAMPGFTSAQTGLIRSALGLAAGERVLDVPSGNGHITLALAAEGLRVSGIDIAADFVAEARGKAAERGLAADFVVGDMRALPWRAEFDAAYCVGNSFGYLEHEGNLEFLAAVARALVPNGRFLLEYPMVAELALARPEERENLELGGIRMGASARYDAENSRIDTTYTFERGREVISRVASYQVYTCRELVASLRAAGFATVELLGDDARGPFARGKSQVLYALGRR